MEPTPSKNGAVEDYTTKLKGQNQKGYSDKFLEPFLVLKNYRK